ncbi:salicylate hydroxylase-like protein [Mytilinidion resinicola]|uniref:Salicylate hydroxylase-like protein n=1 Tax=Mytilinidion resinicola TaxID=574789 RepID=A0A6A6Y5Q4_9PEZI|nr:salicylate hydroxylase-like protein [Mytilinidion resinicola]KAF2804122.1 salicylate hydroxylase-like protein [Mytilinidion resinicola]
MNIIIVGAGIAGLSAGVGLRRAGHKVTILEQSSLVHEVGAAITIKPNASRVLQSWDYVPEQSGMVAIRRGTLIDGTNMQTLIPNYYKDCESTYGQPMYAVHREDLHNQLRLLATQTEGAGRPCDVQVGSKVVNYDAENGTVTTESGEVLQGDLIIAADGVHSKAVKHVIGDGVVQVGDTGWACMRWLVPREEFLSDPETAHMIQDSSTRYFTAAGGAAGLVWYPCRNNEVQNFLYLSREFDTSHVGEDFRAMVESSLPAEYAKKHFDPALQPTFKKARDVKFWKLVARGPIPKWHKDRLLLIGDAAHPMLTFQGQGGGQAIEDGGALSVLFDQLHDTGALEDRLQLFEQVRRNRGSALQILSGTNPPASQSVRDAAAAYLPDGQRFDSTDEINEYVFSYDVLGESKAALLAAAA